MNTFSYRNGNIKFSSIQLNTFISILALNTCTVTKQRNSKKYTSNDVIIMIIINNEHLYCADTIQINPSAHNNTITNTRGKSGVRKASLNRWVFQQS